MSDVPGTNVQLVISAWDERTSPKDIEMYGACVKFFTYWLAKQDGVMGKDTEALFDEFKMNVCKAMAAGTQGTG